MTVSANTQAILLLTAHLGKSENNGAAKPLTPKEWGRFAEWLKQQSLTPEQLLTGKPDELLTTWHDKSVSIDRLSTLLDRGSALALSMEKWMRAGLWVMTRSEPDYPRRLKQRLRGDSPAVLFGCGNRALLNAGGLAVVGSRNVKEQDLAFSRKLGTLAAQSGFSIVSGGARGVDESAMLGALETEGTAIGVLADSLLRASSSGKYRRHLSDKNLVLVSPFNPEAGFNAGNAMQRNKYIYCLADAAFAVHSGKKGGTWSGAQEDLKNRWVPLWVKPTDDPESGNADLIKEGALQSGESIDEIVVTHLFEAEFDSGSTAKDLFSKTSSAIGERTAPYDVETSSTEKGGEEQSNKISDQQKEFKEESDSSEETVSYSQVTFYELFLSKAIDACQHGALTPEELAKTLDVNKTQLNVWLKKAVEEGKLKKLNKPVRYQLVNTNQATLAFD